MNRALILQTLRELRARRREVHEELARAEAQAGHITDHDLERYHLGIVTEEPELARIEEGRIRNNNAPTSRTGSAGRTKVETFSHQPPVLSVLPRI